MNRENNIRLSVLIPTYNRCDKLKNTVEKLMAQVRALKTPGQVEIVVSSNASTDGTEDYLGTLGACDFVTTNTISENLGYGGNVRWLVAHASGEYFQILSDDDVYPDDMIRKELQAISEHKADYYFVPSTASLPSGDGKIAGEYGMREFLERYRMGMALCGSNIFLTSKARELTVESDVWYHCELLFNMNPDRVCVIDELIEVRMPGSDDKVYWHNDSNTVLDYDTQIIEVINKSGLCDACKQILLKYYKFFLFEEIYQYIDAGPYQAEANRIYSERIGNIPLFKSEKKYLRYGSREKAIAAARLRYYARRYVPRLRSVGL